MSEQNQKEVLKFQAEVNQLLHLVINSLYSNKEIFLRELISNSSDAIDKLRFKSLSDSELLKGNPELKIIIRIDKAKKTISIEDTGIGMTYQEVMDHIGTIAKSGTKEFIASLSGDAAKDNQLIGQFGVGFYSAFIVAKRVSLTTRHAQAPADQAVFWESQGEADYSIQTVTKETRGTVIVLKIKDDAEEFLDPQRLKGIITKYSDHITVPIFMEQEAEPHELQQVNNATALWTLPKNQITDAEYSALYKHIAHDFEDPLVWTHNRVEGKLEYTSLFFIPKRAPFDLYQPDRHAGIKLYVRRIYVMDDADHLVPAYLRFVKGIVDCSDLPLNVSREILQNNKLIATIRAATVKKILSILEEMAENDSEKYAIFWSQFGKVLKEGPAEDFLNRDRIAKLLRFATTHRDTQSVSLTDYVARMKENQQAIYYLTADSHVAAKNSPYLEIFNKKDIEVLLLSDQVDEWLMTHLPEFEGKKFQSITRGDLNLGDLEDAQTTEQRQQEKQEFSDVTQRIAGVLGVKIKEARVTHRLTDTPSCIVADDTDADLQMQRILQSMGQGYAARPPILEINPQHPIIKHLHSLQDEERFNEWSHVLLDQAILNEGGQLKDPVTFVKRVNTLLRDTL